MVAVRQLCLSADLIPSSYLEDIRRPSVEASTPSVPITQISPERRTELIEKLKQILLDAEECPVSCLPVVFRCSHAFS